MRQFPTRHAWQVTTAVHQQLRQEAIRHNAFGDVRYVAGVDVGLDRRRATLRAAVVVLRCNTRVRLPETTRQAHSLASGRTWLQ